MSIEITVNGEGRQLAAGTVLAELLEAMELAGRRIAVEINQDIVPRSQHARHVLQAGDKVEIVHAIGGG